jgi:hypothetical protein
VSKKTNTIDALVADLASVWDRELIGEVRSLGATNLLATIVQTPATTWEPGAAGRPLLPRLGRAGRRRGGLLALAAALALTAVFSTGALGVVRDLASFFGAWHDPEAPVPNASDVVIASGEAGSPWRILATTSDRGLCLALVMAGDNAALGGCSPTDVRGDPWALGSAHHWIGPLDVGGGAAALNRNFAYGPLAEEVTSVELLLSDGEAVRAHVVRRPAGLRAPLNFYWAAWPCGSLHCRDAAGPLVRIAIARNAAGHVLERRMPSWSGNPTGDPNGRPIPS